MNQTLSATVKWKDNKIGLALAEFREESLYTIFLLDLNVEELKAWLRRKFWAKFPRTFYHTTIDDLKIEFAIEDDGIITVIEL